MITYLSKLDMRPGSVAPVLHVSQYDSDFQINFDLWASSGDFVIESGTTATVRGTKLDGNGYSAECTLTGNRVAVEGDIQMTAIAGDQIFEITLHNGEKELNSANFILAVERAAMDKDTFTSDSKILEAYAIVDRTDEIIAAANKVENAVSSIDETIATELVELAKETNIGLSDRSKIALLNCLKHLAWIDGQGQSLYEELENALYEQDIKAIVSIDAVFTQGSLIVYEDTSLESLRDYLTVTATYTDQSTKEVVNYNLSGTLREGTSTVTVEYGSKRDTFSVVVSGRVEIESITASFDQGTVVFYEDSSLDELRPYLTVRAIYTDETTVIIDGYTLSGTFNAGSNTISVSYEGFTDTFTVNVERGLPSGYTRLQYISTNGLQYINIGANETQVESAVYEVMPTSVSAEAEYGYGSHILSSRSTYFPLFKILNLNYPQVNANNRGNESASAPKDFQWEENVRYKIEAFTNDTHNNVDIDGIEIYKMNQGSSVSASNNFYLFTYGGNPSAGRYRFCGNLYRMSIYNSSGETIRHFIPAKNNDNVAGLYDVVNSIFYISNTEYPIIAGEIV